MKITKMKNLKECMNGGFLLYLKHRYGRKRFDNVLLRYTRDQYLEFTIIDKTGLFKKIYVDIDDYKKFTNNTTITDYQYDYLIETFGHCSCMRWIADLFNIPMSHDYWNSISPCERIELVIKKLHEGDSIFEYKDDICKYWLASERYFNGEKMNEYYASLQKAVPDTADFLVGGKAEVFRNGDSFTVSIRTTASRYDIHTLAKKISVVKKDVDQMAVDALCKNQDFIKLGLQPGLYKADRVTITRDRRMVYVFDLKDRVRELLKENEKDVE